MKRMAKGTAWVLLAVGALAGAGVLAQKGSQGQMGEQYPAYVGSIQVQEDQGGQSLQALAKVSAQQAVQAAQAALGTTQSPTKVRLSVENGYLVWEVVLGGQEVKVDAGNGQVLHKEAVNQGEHEEGEHGEASGEEGGVED
ncbi:PepSY domain-containing protein [Thermus albus]|uniref:PepSY domain-containing protein n=1 Tax=Thermus albus TaxID=2908146 RepID=UPI001FAB1AE0|nr:PepSY domain-containing protein [Thermus albus]